MTANRRRSAAPRAWIWLAVAALAVSCASRAQAGIESAAAYTHPVLQFLAGQSASDSVDAHNPRPQHTSRLRDAQSGGAWQAVLPVLFIGLIAPLSLIAPRSAVGLGRPPASPARPFLFQRPPPSLLV